jgi:ATP synthase F1 delta subunit
MDSLTVDHTYGQALYDVARERGIISEVAEEYKAVSKVFADNPEFRRLLLIPMLSALEKRDAAEKVFRGRITKELLNFIFVLIDKRRMGTWESIERHFEKLVLENDGLTKGVLYSALPIDDERLKAIEKKTETVVGNGVRLEGRIDKSLIGGVRIYIDGKLIDASVKTRLENMRQRIKT